MQNSITSQPIGGYKLIVGYIGVITMMIGCMILMPLLILIAFPEDWHDAKYFMLPGTVAFLLGYMMNLTIRNKPRAKLKMFQDTIIVSASWILAIIFAAVPFYLTGHYSVTQSIFEATSGLTTTGLSVVDVSSVSHLFLLHRSIIMFFGGIGLVLVMVSALSDVFGMRLYNAEGHTDKLMPNLIKSARAIITIYSGYIIAGSFLYIYFGMNWFDAINHSITAVATGGFSTKVDSIAAFQSFPIEVVSMVLMLLGATNFLAQMLLIRGKFKNFFKYSEVRFLIFFLAMLIPSIAVFFVYSFGGSMSHGFRIAAFQAISAVTTAGFQTVSMNDWTSILMLLMIFLMLMGGGTGSTAGGMKVYRVYIFLKCILWDISDRCNTSRVVKERYIYRPDGKEFIGVKEKSQVLSFILLYLLLFFIGSGAIAAFGFPLDKAMFEFSSALGNVGVSCGIMNYDCNPIVLWIGTIGMFLGRLEIYVIFVAIFKMTKDVKTKCKNRR